MIKERIITASELQTLPELQVPLPTSYKTLKGCLIFQYTWLVLASFPKKERDQNQLELHLYNVLIFASIYMHHLNSRC